MIKNLIFSLPDQHFEQGDTVQLVAISVRLFRRNLVFQQSPRWMKKIQVWRCTVRKCTFLKVEQVQRRCVKMLRKYPLLPCVYYMEKNWTQQLKRVISVGEYVIKFGWTHQYQQPTVLLICYWKKSMEKSINLNWSFLNQNEHRSRQLFHQKSWLK